jgi:peptidoglycan/LPS O-acetylase OafA/YrhL
MSPMGRGAARSAGEKLVFIEGLRALAALYVVLGHICSMADPGIYFGIRGTGPEWLRILMQPFGYGHLAVAGFIVISGFCLQTSLFNGGKGALTDPKRFYRRRAYRILPPYYACLAISYIVALYVTPLGEGLPFSQYIPVTNVVLASHVFMFHNFSPDWMYKINGVLWSIAIEVQLYLLFPLLVGSLRRYGRPLTLLAAGGVSALVLLAFPGALKLYPWYLALFALGMSTAHLAFKPPKWRGPNAFAALLVAAGALYGCIWSESHRLAMPVSDAWMGAVLVCVLYAGTISKRLWLSRALSWGPLAGLGAMSYSLYLMHHPIMQTVYLFRPSFIEGPLASTLYLSTAGMLVILIFCAVFWLIFERPFISRRTRRPSKTEKDIPLRTTAAVFTSDRSRETVARR